MDTVELLKKVRKIEIKTRGLSSQIFSGEYHSAFKGRGMAFSEVREYSPGDEIRTIDWNVTARFNTPYVKVFEEERELNVMLVIDMSESGVFGSHSIDKRELITEIAAVLAFSAIQNKDNTGAILFTDTVEKYIPPKKGRKHILRIISELLNFEPKSRGTNIHAALRFLENIQKKRSICFLISDFLDGGYENTMKVLNRKHDLVAIRVSDEREKILPDIGLVKLTDAETGISGWINTSSKQVRMTYAKRQDHFEKLLREMFKKAGVDMVSISTDESYIKPLMNLFKNRTR